MIETDLNNYKINSNTEPIYLIGDALNVLKSFPENYVDCIITSPPYWGQRQYENNGIGLENTYTEFIENLLNIIEELKKSIKADRFILAKHRRQILQ